jgi:hypothetical protein
MDTKKEGARGPAATGSKMAASKKPQQSTGETSAAANQGTTGQQGQGGEQNLIQHAKHATGEIVNQVQQQAGSQIERQKESAANDLSQVVNAVRRFGETLATEEGGPIARYAAEYGDKAAQKLEQLTNYIREQDPKRLLDDVQNFGRRRPALMIGGAFLLGLAGARLIKSSMDTGVHHSYRSNVPAPSLSGTNLSAGQPSPTPGAI